MSEDKEFCNYDKNINCLLSIFYSIDFIGRQPKLKLNQRPRNQTVMGGILCIIMFAVFIPAALYFGQELVFRNLPKIIEASIPVTKDDYINVSKNGFSFFVSLRDNNGQLYSTDNYLDLSLEIITATAATNQNSNEFIFTAHPIEIKQCDLNSFPNDTESDHGINNKYLHLFKCIKDTQNLTINGTNHLQSFSYLQLKITKCKQQPLRPQCKSSDEIDRELKTMRLILKYYDTEYNQREFEDYSSLHIKEDIFALNNQVDKEVIVSLTKTDFYTDIGYIFEDFRLKTFHNIIYIKEKDFLSVNNDYYINMIFHLNYSKLVNYRKYYKFQNWVAELGGIVKAISLIATIINYFNDKSSYYELMINKLFDVDDIIKYYQYFDLDNINLIPSKKRKKRDSIVLLNAKKEKDYFVKEELNRIGTDKHSLSNQGNNMISPKKSLKRIINSFNKGDFDIGNNNSNYCLTGGGGGGGNINNSKTIKSINNANTSFNNSNANLLNRENTNLNCGVISSPNNNNNNFINNTSNINSNTIQQIAQSHNPQSVELSEVDPHESYINALKKNKSSKTHFEKIKKDRFSLHMFEQIVFCFCNKKDNPKFNALIGGRELITERSDIIYILKKNLEFDRLKNLILRDNQMLLLNSLTKFMLDPERVNLIDFKHCSYDKFIDLFDEVASGQDMIDIKLSKWVATKFKLEHLTNSNLRSNVLL